MTKNNNSLAFNKVNNNFLPSTVTIKKFGRNTSENNEKNNQHETSILSNNNKNLENATVNGKAVNSAQNRKPSINDDDVDIEIQSIQESNY